MKLPADLQAAVAGYADLRQWDRAELGRSLRRLGLSYGEIMHLIPVAKGTLASWCREVRLTDLQIEAIKDRCGPAAAPRNTQWRRRLEIERIEANARHFAIEHLDDAFWVAGTVLYWGEGSKTQRSLAVANSDARLLRLFISWCRTYHAAGSDFVLSLHLHEGNHDVAARSHWRRELGVSEFTKTFIKARGSGHRKNRLPWGVCRVRMRRSTDAYVRTLAWIETLAAEQARLANLPDGSLAQSGRATDS